MVDVRRCDVETPLASLICFLEMMQGNESSQNNQFLVRFFVGCKNVAVKRNFFLAFDFVAVNKKLQV